MGCCDPAGSPVKRKNTTAAYAAPIVRGVHMDDTIRAAQSTCWIDDCDYASLNVDKANQHNDQFLCAHRDDNRGVHDDAPSPMTHHNAHTHTKDRVMSKHNNETVSLTVEVSMDDILDAVDIGTLINEHAEGDAGVVLNELDIDDILEYVAESDVMSHDGCDEFLETIVDLPYVRKYLARLRVEETAATVPYQLNLIAPDVHTIITSSRQVGVVVRDAEGTVSVVIGTEQSRFGNMDDAVLFVDAKMRRDASESKAEREQQA